MSFMDINPWTRGHALVIPRNHSRNLLDIGDDDLAHVAAAAKRLAVRMRERLGLRRHKSSELLRTCGVADRVPLPRARDPALRRRPAAPSRGAAAGGPGRAPRGCGGAPMRPLLPRVGVAWPLSGLAVAQDDEGTVTDGDDSRSRADIASAHAAHDHSERPARARHPLPRAHLAGHLPQRRRRARAAGNGLRQHLDPPHAMGGVAELRGLRDRATAPRTRWSPASASSGRTEGSSAGGRPPPQLTSRRRLVVRFDPDQIRRPAAYRWSVQATTFERGCTRRGCQDFAPGRGRSPRGSNWVRPAAEKVAFRRLSPDSVSASRGRNLAGFQPTCRSSECVEHRAGRKTERCFTHAYRNRQVVQRREGIRVHHA